MRCPACKKDEDRVLDTRSSQDADVIRRRRSCTACGRRYTTFERIEAAPMRVVKKDGTRVPFDRRKILGGMLKACEKRPVALSALEDVVNRIETEIYRQYDREVPSQVMGTLVMKALRELDQVAYVRFASVYREFKDISAFIDELKPMLGTRARRQGAGK
jgi:transcriptional repressor NrdR